jgi:LmbE family N-acetylglucosaminyl deacetylase
MPVPLDLLVFGPHPDDLEIGVGGTIARQTSMGLSVGLCDLTAGEMGSNGTPDVRMG